MGFLKVLDDTTIGFADYRGNRQMISKGNLTGDDNENRGCRSGKLDPGAGVFPQRRHRPRAPFCPFVQHGR